MANFVSLLQSLSFVAEVPNWKLILGHEFGLFVNQYDLSDNSIEIVRQSILHNSNRYNEQSSDISWRSTVAWITRVTMGSSLYLQKQI